VGDRLGWLGAPGDSLAHWSEWEACAAAARRDGLRRVLVCGMGGSSLAPRVLAESFGAGHLQVLDSTDPAAVRAAESAADVGTTLFVVTSKSGTTVETLAFYRYFAARAEPRQFVAVTDPGTPLERLARERGFRGCFPHPANVGGRYSALTVVGMLPAALAGIDGPAVLERARAVDVPRARAFGAQLAAQAAAGRDKLLLTPPAPVQALADWIEQLVAESSGKDGRGIVPLVGDPSAALHPEVQQVSEFSADPLDLGAEFQRWMHATVAACESLGVNPFDQPDVEIAKSLAREELARGAAAPQPPDLQPLSSLERSLGPGDYLAILAYLRQDPDVTAALEGVRRMWGERTGRVTTLAFGPRYLHSTGQLHKGGPNHAAFLVVTADTPRDLAIPELGTTFGALERAQALGDIRALVRRGRRVAHVHLGGTEDIAAALCP
jgi:hypothetical protein